MSAAMNLIIARGFPEAGTAFQRGMNNQRQADDQHQSVQINQAGAQQNQQFNAEDQAAKAQQHFAQQGQEAEIKALYSAAEEFLQKDQSDPKVQNAVKAIALRLNSLQQGAGTAAMGIVDPKPASRGAPVKVSNPDGSIGFAYPDEAVSQGMQPYVAPPGGGSVAKPPQGYVWRDPANPSSGVDPLPGGPADPSASGGASGRNRMALRKEFRKLPSVQDYETSLPLLVSARKAPDTPAGDLQVIYTVGKILDPNSVVREGELQLTKDAAPWLQKMVGEARKQLDGQGTLTPATRASLLDALNQRVMSYRQAYERDYRQYASYAQQSGFAPADVVGRHAANAYQGNGKKAPDPLGIR